MTLASNIKSGVGFGAKMIKGGKLPLDLIGHNTYRIECVKPDCTLRWAEDITNLITNEGLDDILDKYLKGSAYTASFFVGLIDNAAFVAIAAGDTAAGITTDALGSNGWGEVTEYTEGARQSLTLGAVASQSVDNSASKAAFSINATITLKGAFIATASAKLATTGVLYGAAAFAATRAAENGDTLNVTATFTSASA